MLLLPLLPLPFYYAVITLIPMLTTAAVDKAGKEFKVLVEIKGCQLLLTFGELWKAFEWFCQVWAVRKDMLTWGHLSDSKPFAGRFRRLFFSCQENGSLHIFNEAGEFLVTWNPEILI